jgi:phosphate acetyltransferase
MLFIENIKERVKLNKKTIVLVETNDKRVQDAAKMILDDDIANLILLGDPVKELENAKFVKIRDCDLTNKLTDELYEIRKHKGMTQQQAHELLLQDPLYYGVMLVKSGIADGMVAGATYPTSNVLRPALQILKTQVGVKFASGYFIMVTHKKDLGYNGCFLFADCGINQNPTPEILADIAFASAKSFRDIFKAEPIVAMLSHSTFGSSVHADVKKISDATDIIKSRNPDFKIDGELQLDAAIIEHVAKIKAPNSDVAGRANVLIFPDLDAGNIGYKLVQRFGDAEAYGPIAQGISKPVNDLSRGCSTNDVFGTIMITALQASFL